MFQFKKYQNENWTQVKILSFSHEKLAKIVQNFMTKAQENSNSKHIYIEVVTLCYNL